jgi:acetyltransferase-like isoleucine patch superfamily enzyme
MNAIVRIPKIWKPSNVYPSAKLGNGTTVGAFCEIGDKVVIGCNCKIGAYSFIPKGVTIEDDCFIGPRTTFTNDKHPQVRGRWKLLKTRVMKGASIGAGSVILPGLTIGQYAIIGAGSVVTKDVMPAVRVCGCPAHLMINDE